MTRLVERERQTDRQRQRGGSWLTHPPVRVKVISMIPFNKLQASCRTTAEFTYSTQVLGGDRQYIFICVGIFTVCAQYTHTVLLCMPNRPIHICIFIFSLSLSPFLPPFYFMILPMCVYVHTFSSFLPSTCIHFHLFCPVRAYIFTPTPTRPYVHTCSPFLPNMCIHFTFCTQYVQAFTLFLPNICKRFLVLVCR